MILLTHLVCCRSDADADVLADYVLALLRQNGDAHAVRKLCEAEIPDFLKEGETLAMLRYPKLFFFDSAC